MKFRPRGFTIVELLVVIVVIAIMAAITMVAYNGIQARAAAARRDSDVAQYYKAILLARENTGKTLADITGSTYSAGTCTMVSYNPSGTQPKDLSKSHVCWTRYYDNLTKVGTAAGMNLDGLRGGDANGNPYILDENEGEQACPSKDGIFYFYSTGVLISVIKQIPRFDGCS
jgi:prepilin-type N-terminal cleavage/methylation domain-containing protein